MIIKDPAMQVGESYDIMRIMSSRSRQVEKKKKNSIFGVGV